MTPLPVVLPDLLDSDLRLRPPRSDDVPAIARICQDPDVQRWTRVPSPYTEADAEDFVSMHAVGLERGTGIHLLAADVSSDQPLGAVGLDIDHRDWSAELGYWVAPESRGRGVATRSARLLIRFALDHLVVRYVTLQAAVDNPSSNSVARRLGFTLEGTSRDAMLIGPTGDPSAPRGDAHRWGLRPGELT